MAICREIEPHPCLSQTPRIKPPALRPGDTSASWRRPAISSADLFEAGCNALRNRLPAIYLDSSSTATSTSPVGRAPRPRIGRDVRARRCAGHPLRPRWLRLRTTCSTSIRQRSRPTQNLRRLQRPHQPADLFLRRGGLVTFQAPWSPKTCGARGRRFRLLASRAPARRLGRDPASPGVRALVPGDAEGILYGGCLSMLVASLGTPYEIRTDGTSSFLKM